MAWDMAEGYATNVSAKQGAGMLAQGSGQLLVRGPCNRSGRCRMSRFAVSCRPTWAGEQVLRCPNEIRNLGRQFGFHQPPHRFLVSTAAFRGRLGSCRESQAVPLNPTHEVEVDGAVLAVEFAPGVHRGAVPVAFLHAGVADSRMWDAQQAIVAGSRPTLRCDRRGFGASRIQYEATHSHVADLCAVLDKLGIERATFVGCSQGGRIALDLALALPRRVVSMLLVAPAVSGAPDEVPQGATRSLADAIEAADDAADLDAVNQLEAQLWLDGPAGPVGRVSGPARDLFLDMNGMALRSPAAGDELDAPSAWERLQDVRCPTWVLWGDLDLPQLQDRCELLVQRIAGARRVVLSGAAHLPPLEAPGRFNAELVKFLAA